MMGSFTGVTLYCTSFSSLIHDNRDCLGLPNITSTLVLPGNSFLATSKALHQFTADRELVDCAHWIVASLERPDS